MRECVCSDTVALVRNTAWDITGQEPGLHSSVHSKFFFFFSCVKENTGDCFGHTW